MKILKINKYKDGGTIILHTDKGDFCIDNRMFSTTKHKVYDGYPKKDNSNLLNNTALETELFNELKNYKNSSHQNTIDHINSLHL